MNRRPHEVRIFVPGWDEDAASVGLRRLTRALHAAHPDQERGGGLGGGDGYGVDYESDLFLMRPYCWCERGDCPWCGGCQTEWPYGVEHRRDCYQWRVHDALVKLGWSEDALWKPPPGPWVPHLKAPDGMGYDAYTAQRDRVTATLCVELGLTHPWGSAGHCTCGAAKARRDAFNACRCDWHAGRPPFRFGPATRAPNFWHKPSGARINWYKWIGRGMECSIPDGVDIAAVIDDCIRSVGGSLAEDS